jgi:alginate O-acetyltransferase complex protein AlgI
MGHQVDLYSVRFWVCVAVATIALNPLRSPRARRWTFAAINLGFVILHLGAKPSTLAVPGGLFFGWLALRLAAGGRQKSIALAAAGIAVLVLFFVHKAAWWIEGLSLGRLSPALEIIGFSYVALRWVDVSRAVGEGRRPAPDLTSLFNYLIPFHMLAAGPIQAYDEFVDQPGVPPPPRFEEVLSAFERIAAGLFKKYIFSNYIDKLFLTGFHAAGAYNLIEMQLNFIWLYLDFSAYSDVAVGVGRLMGVATPENFNKPYLARNVIDFWERWHISLSQFIRRNLFFPLQVALMRRTDGKHALTCASISFAVSFLLCGLWHRIGFAWLAWGALQAAGLIICNLYRYYLTKRLGRKGVQAYLADRWIRILAILLTFEFEAFTVMVVTYPFSEVRWWTTY